MSNLPNKHTTSLLHVVPVSPTKKQIKKAILLCSLLLVLNSLTSLAQTNTWVQKSDFGYDESNVTEPATRNDAVGFSIGSKGYIGTGRGSGFTLKDFWEYDPAADTWTQKADFGGTARFDAVGFSIGSKGYIGTGSLGYPDYTNYKDFWEYDPDANSWTQKADFGGTARSGSVGFSIGSKGYIGTGSDGSYKQDFWEYDPAADTWTQKEVFGRNARYDAVGFSIGSKGYIGTGYDGNYKKDFWEYDPVADTWTQKADFGGTSRSAAVGFSIGGKGYLGTGSLGYPDYTNYKDFWEYDPDANTWAQILDFKGPNGSNAVGFSIGSKGYLGTGSKKDFWQYDPAANDWIRKADFGQTAREGAVAFSIGSKGYIGMGYSYGITKDFWEYDPAANTWTQKADFGGTARWGAVGFSIGSKGYLGTGFDDSSYYKKDFWEYDPAVNTWTQKADFGGVGHAFAVGFSIGSKGYIGTGSGYFGLQKDFWEYDPAANAWVQKADFGGTARYGAVGFSIGNKGYIGTGRSDNDYKKDFWEYDPVANTWTQKTDFGGAPRNLAVGFSIGMKGFLGTGGKKSGLTYRDFWEYNPAANTWTQKADFGGIARDGAVGFSIGSEGYLGTGYSNGVDTKDFWKYTPDIVLPLQLIRFNAALQKTNTLLDWQTANEINTDYFNIQRSFNGSSFTTIAKQNAAGNGITQQYIYSDDNVTALQQPTIFYRLQMVDKDGSFTYSNIVQLKINNSTGILVTIYPNPTNGNFSLQIHLPDNAASTTLSLYNNLGVKVWQQNAGKLSGFVNRNIALESKLSAGVYVLMVQHGDTRLMKKVVVVK